MLDIPVPEVTLQRAGIVALVRQGEAAGMAQHVRVDGELEASLREEVLIYDAPESATFPRMFSSSARRI